MTAGPCAGFAERTNGPRPNGQRSQAYTSVSVLAVPVRHQGMRYVLTIGGHDNPGHAFEPITQLRLWQRRVAGSGAVLTVVPLRPPHTATTMRFHGGGVMVCDEPCVPEPDSIVAYAVIEADDLDRALELVRTWNGRGYIEVRPMSGEAQ